MKTDDSKSTFQQTVQPDRLPFSMQRQSLLKSCVDQLLAAYHALDVSML